MAARATKKPQTMCGVFDAIPVVPITHFWKASYSQEVYRMAWQLVGPTIDRNRSVNLQQLLCIAFMEGINLASNMMNERFEKERKEMAQTLIDAGYGTTFWEDPVT